MFDPTVEKPIPLKQVPLLNWIPGRRPGKRIGDATIWRWALRGIRGIKLESILIGGQRCTSEMALKRFFEAIERPDLSSNGTNPAERNRQIQHAENILKRANIAA